jgi:peptidoglycan/xylan/chitin deacetylase (PgdA/CDA1 family)
MWQVYQELKKREMTATFYVITRRLELLPEQWRQIDQDGFEVAAHTRNHPDLRGSNNWEGEITGSKLDLEAILGHPVRTFAYPYGKYNNSITQVVINSGFELAVTTEGGYNWSLGTTFKQPTVSVVGDDTLNDFIGKVKAGR